MEKTDNQSLLVSKYFDSIASRYANHYTRENSYHAYFLLERLAEATEGFEFEEKSVLDVGAGTGALYDYLKQKQKIFDYIGVDISSEMLSKSNIPSDLQRHGSIQAIVPQQHQFDYIFMLGLTTYLTRQNLLDHIQCCSRLLAKDGKLVVSFTNRRSIDAFIRWLIGPIVRAFKSGKGVLQQKFVQHKYTTKDAMEALNPFFQIETIKWQNQTVTPFNQIFPSASIIIAKQSRKLKSSFLLPILSSDFTLILRRHDSV